MDRVAVKVKDEKGNVIKVAHISRDIAEREAKRQPNVYELISPPKIEVLKLEPIVEKVEKKSVEDAPSVSSEEKTIKKPAGRPKKTV